MDPSLEPGCTPDAERFFRRARELLPSFALIDDERRPEWDDETGVLAYPRVANLAWHLADIAGRGDLESVRPILDEAEATIASGDRFARDLMIVGLLEDLQNAILQSAGRVRLLDVRGLLGPQSVGAWDDLMRFWHGTDLEARRRLPPGSLPDRS